MSAVRPSGWRAETHQYHFKGAIRNSICISLRVFRRFASWSRIVAGWLDVPYCLDLSARLRRQRASTFTILCDLHLSSAVAAASV